MGANASFSIISSIIPVPNIDNDPARMTTIDLEVKNPYSLPFYQRFGIKTIFEQRLQMYKRNHKV